MSWKVADFYRKEAGRLGYPARSVFKLQEIHERFSVLKQGRSVLDLGCAPGSWMLFSSKLIGKHGRLVGVDISDIKASLMQEVEKQCHVKLLRANIMTWEAPEVLRDRFDVVLSDVAPRTMGVKALDGERSFVLSSRALDLSYLLLNKEKRASCAVIKIFQSELSPVFEQQAKGLFQQVHMFTPKACRKQSTETYLIASGPVGL